MTKDTKSVVVKEGTIIEALKNTAFRVALEETDELGEPVEVFAHLSGKLRRYYIKVFTGDKVRLEFSPHDLTQGRIVYRYNAQR